VKKTIEALNAGRLMIRDGIPGDVAAKAFYYEMDTFVFDAVLKRSNEMNANVFLAGREWNDIWNENMGGEDE